MQNNTIKHYILILSSLIDEPCSKAHCAAIAGYHTSVDAVADILAESRNTLEYHTAFNFANTWVQFSYLSLLYGGQPWQSNTTYLY